MASLRIVLLLLALLPTAAWPIEQFTVEIVEKKPQPRENFVQGLEILDGYLYVSTGGYGTSRLLRYHFADVSLDKSLQLGRRIFAEGLTIHGDTLYQLTWRNRVMLTYDKDTLQPRGITPISGEGWGITNDGKSLIISDGSEHLHFMSAKTGKLQRRITVTEQGGPLKRLNELEWIDGKIWANVWQTDRIVIIDPTSGEVTASIDLRGLLPVAEHRHGTDVLNGIARNPADGAVWVTGKRWPWLYRIELVPTKQPETKHPQ